MLTNRKVKAQATRQMILDNAEDVFLETGLSGASLEEIAKCCGVTRGAIYWHFKNRGEVFEAVFERTVSFYENLLVDITQKANSLKEFEDFTTDLLKRIASDRKRQRALCILLLRHEWLPSEPKIIAASRESNARTLRVIVDFFTRMQASGQLSDMVPTKIMAEACLFYMQGLIGQFLRHPEAVNLKKNAQNYTRLFFNALDMAEPQKKGGKS